MKKFMFVLSIFLISLTGYGESIKDKLLELGISVVERKVKSIDFELKDINGNLKRLSSYRGKFVFLNFWATWCGPCRIEMPSMQRLYNELNKDGFEIIAVDLMEDKKVVKKFLNQNNLTFPVLLDTNGKVGALYGVRSIPTTYLIDKDGYIIARQVGAREWDTQEIKSIFKEILKNGR